MSKEKKTVNVKICFDFNLALITKQISCVVTAVVLHGAGDQNSVYELSSAKGTRTRKASVGPARLRGHLSSFPA